MPGVASCRAVRRCAVGLLAALIGSVSLTPVRAQDEVRALWVVRTTLTSPTAVAAMVGAARTSGFNTLLVQIRGRADAYYASGLEPRPLALAAQPVFDPLATTIALAHEAGLQVHAWINVNLVGGVNELPSAPDHVIYRHPEWLMVPRALTGTLADVDPRSPEYLGRLTRYVRAQPTELEGLYLSPMTGGAIDYTSSVVRDIVERYDVDGVHFDYARYPTDDFDYSREALAAFRHSVTADLTPGEARRADGRLAEEPLFYTRAYSERWRAFRTARLTALMARLRQTVKGVKPSALVSAAVAPDLTEAATRRLQDWRGWLESDLIDIVCPMAYTTDGAAFASQIAAARQTAGRHPLWAGIGAYRLSPAQIVENVRTARRLGVGGIALFSYDTLTAPSRGPDYLAQLGLWK